MSKKRSFSTIRTLLNRNALLYPDRIAVKEAGSAGTATFEALKDRANRIGNALFSIGARKGDRIAILSQNSFEYIESALGVANAGLIFVVLNFRLALRELLTVLLDSEPSILMVQDQYSEYADTIKNAVPSIREFIFIGPEDKKPEGWHGYEELIKSAASAEQNTDVFEDDIAMLMYTSGTTGAPKGVMQTHENFYHNGRACAKDVGLDMDDIGFIVCPMFHITAHSNFFSNFYSGAVSFIFPRWDVELFLKTVEKERLTEGMLATPMVRMLLDYPELNRYDFSSLKKLWFAGAGIIPSVYKQFIDVFGNILGEMHGTTETTGVTTYLSTRDIQEAFDNGETDILATCGRSSFDMEVLIVDDNDGTVPPGGIGEMKVKGHSVSLGYWRKEIETEAVFKGDWFYTGDVCRVGKNGFIALIDRKKDLIITGGENVYPAEVERVLHEHPSVSEAAVIGIPHPVWGEAIAAIVALKDGENITGEEITGFCRSRIAGYKIPKSVLFVPALPRNSSGKILRRELKEQYKSLQENPS
jgi:acyl-CoA synthetase (AMP-forming)/AMP-acid ligase II